MLPDDRKNLIATSILAPEGSRARRRATAAWFLHARITGIDPEHGPDIEGMQVEVDPSVGKHTGGLYESGGRGWVKMPAAEGEQALKSGEWNDLEVSVEGNHIVTQLNGVKIVDFVDPVAEIHRWRDWLADSHRRRREDGGRTFHRGR